MESDIVIAPSTTEANTFYIFRRNGIEVKVKIMGLMVQRSHRLSKKEWQYMNAMIKKTDIEKEPKIIKLRSV